MKKRTASILFLSMLVAGGLQPLAATAAEFPTKPMTLVVGAAPGGPTDIMARLLAKEMGELLRQPIVVDNKPGANSLIATDVVARSERDGYTLLLAYNAHVVNPMLMKSAKYDAQKDFAPVGLAVNLPMAVLAAPGARFNPPPRAGGCGQGQAGRSVVWLVGAGRGRLTLRVSCCRAA